MNLTIYLIVTLLIFVITFSGCLTSESYVSIKYSVSIITEDNATVYVPILLDLPDKNTSDMVSLFKLKTEPGSKINVSFKVVDTNFGASLRINTNGNVTLEAIAGGEYLRTHPKIPTHPFTHGDFSPMFFDFSMRINTTYPENRAPESYHWAYLEPNNQSEVKIKISQQTSYKGIESWDSLEDNSTYPGYFTLKPGWQTINFDHVIGVH